MPETGGLSIIGEIPGQEGPFREMKIYFVILVFMTSAFWSYGQNSTDSIQVRKVPWTVYSQNGKNLTPSEMMVITKSNEAAFREMKIANSNFIACFIFAYTGCLLAAWPVCVAIDGGDPNWTLAGIGGGLFAFSIPFATGYNKHVKKAVGIYNSGLRSVSVNEAGLWIGPTSGGIGLKICF